MLLTRLKFLGAPALAFRVGATLSAGSGISCEAKVALIIDQDRDVVETELVSSTESKFNDECFGGLVDDHWRNLRLDGDIVGVRHSLTNTVAE